MTERNQKIRIVFMGTPDFALASLAALVTGGWQVVAVVTAPDRPAGRGLKLKASPVKDYAVQHQIPVLQPEKLRSKAFLEELKAFRADLQVVVAFRMLPEAVWSMPPLGTINLHASLLPDYRGAAPINWAIIRGEPQTGVTTFFIEREIDTGKIIFREPEPIREDDTAGDLHDRLMYKGADLVTKTVAAIASGNYPETDQPAVPDEEKTAPKLYRETCEIDWTSGRRSIYNFVRGLSPFPGAWTKLDGYPCKIFRVAEADYAGEGNEAYGSMVTDKRSFILFKAADGWVSVLELQLEGKRRMSVADFLRGYR